MAIDPEDLIPKPKQKPLDLGALSIAELEQRIAGCEAEIARCREMIERKRADRGAAEAFFKQPG